MRGLKQLTMANIKLSLRDPIGTFFTLAFPPLLVLLFGAMYGNDPTPMFGGYGSMDVSMPAYTGLILGSVGLLGVPITLGSYREQGVLRRFRATPMRPITYIVADVVANVLLALLGVLVLVTVGWLLYRVRFEGQVGSALAGVIIAGLPLFAIGYLIASVMPSARSAQVVSMAVFYPMMFLSGAGIPLEIMPENVRRISEYLPLTYSVKLMKGLWFGGRWGDHATELVVLGVVLVVFTGLAARFFRWE